MIVSILGITRYNWEKFENNICLLIGLSLNDPNLRRLLDTAKNKNKRTHHIIKIRPGINDIKRNLKKLLKNDKVLLNEKNETGLEMEETAKNIRDLEEKFFEEDALSLGVQTIWAENDDDIGKILQDIKMDP